MHPNRDSVAFAQLLGVPKPLVWMVPLLVRALFWVTLEKGFLAVGQELIMLAATAKPLLLVGQELMFAYAATMTLVLWELPLFVVRLLLLLGCLVDVRWRRQGVVWISVMSIPSLRAFSLACHQLTVIVLRLSSLTVVARIHVWNVVVKFLVETKTSSIRVLRVGSGVLRWGRNILYSRRQKVCMTRRGLVAL